MAETLALIDYGAGNLQSVANALEVAGAPHVVVTADPDVVMKADRVVLPGVGSFKACANGLRSVPGLDEAMAERVLNGGVPFLGICVGMQLLATYGIEHGRTGGLDWIGGKVCLMERSGSSIRIPHMGWNDVVLSSNPAAAGLIVPGEAYFLHSYQFVADDPGAVLAMTDHGGPVTAAVARDNIIGVQFHPEKSQAYGLGFLARFLAWKP